MVPEGEEAFQRILGRVPTSPELAAQVAVLDSTRDLRSVEIAVAALWVNQPGSST